MFNDQATADADDKVKVGFEFLRREFRQCENENPSYHKVYFAVRNKYLCIFSKNIIKKSKIKSVFSEINIT